MIWKKHDWMDNTDVEVEAGQKYVLLLSAFYNNFVRKKKK